MLKTITWPQVATVALLLVATGAAYRFLGLPAATASGVLTTLVAFLAGRSALPPAGGAQ